MNEPPDILEILRHFTVDPVWIVLLGAVGGWYFLAFRRAAADALPRRHPTWKAFAFGGGLVALAIGTLSPIEHYGNTLLWVDFLGFLLITMIGAPLLVLGSPLTLAFRSA